MKRRRFVKRAALGALAGGSLAACGGETSGGAPAVQTQPRLQWRLASSFPRSLDTIFGAAEVMAQHLEAMTDGRFRIRVSPAGELVGAFEVLGAVQRGSAQIGHTASYYFKGQNPACIFDCSVPFGLTSRQHTAWLLHGGGLELMRSLFADFNIVNLPGGNTGVQMGGWFRREVPTLESLRGLRMRIPGFGGEVMSRLGVSVQTIAGGEIYPALERGVIDATEWVGPYDDEKLGFHQVATNYYYPGWWEPGPALTFYVNKDAWEGLPSTYREALAAAAQAASLDMQARYDAENPAALGRLLETGVTLRPFADEIMQAARTETTDLLEAQASDDAAFRAIYDAWKQFRDDSFRWFDTAEQAFARFAFGAI